MPDQITLDKIWQAVLGDMELSVGRACFTTWLSNTKIISIEGEIALIRVPSEFSRQWLEKKYNKQILSSLKGFCTNVKEVQYIIGGNIGASKESLVAQKALDSVNQSARGKSSGIKILEIKNNLDGHRFSARERTGLSPKYTFETFVIGSNNALAEAAARAVADDPGNKYNPLFIYGGVGLGKTHLLQAIGNEVLNRNRGAKIKYTSAENFANELVNSIRKKEVVDFKEKYRKIDAFLIDDIQFLGGKQKSQEEFFHIYNTLHQTGKQIVLCSDRPPREIHDLEDRLCSRFEGGMMADISQPDLETRMAILDIKARNQGKELNQDVLGYIASNIQNNIRELEGALNKFIATCDLQNWEFNLKNAKMVMATILSANQTKALTMSFVLKKVTKFYNLRIEDLLGTSRRSEIVKPRQIAIYLIRKEARSSFPNIGDFFKKDHSTIMHSFKKIKELVKFDENLLREINSIRDILYRKEKS